MVEKYRKKPVVIDAVLWTGKNDLEVLEFMGTFAQILRTKEIMIDTLEGTMLASVGDYIIKGVNGEFYPCKPDIFEKTYEKVSQ